jgi:hypothetical protein
MKTILIAGFIGLLLISCSKNVVKSHKPQKTPSNMVMTHSEKQDVNYDARENHKAVEKNARNKDANQKIAEKNRKKYNNELNKLNANSSKVKKKKSAEAFGFY